jgi:hypothetical protein
MASKFKITAGRWWRGRRFELRDGMIRPGKSATLEIYDPWAEYSAVRAARGTKSAPYESLLSLLQKLDCRPGTNGRRYSLSRHSENLLVEWCCGHGLLGLLPHRVQVVTLAPRWWLPAPGAKVRGRDVPPNALYPAQGRFVRTSSGWEAYRTVAWERMHAAGKRGSSAGSLIREGSLVYPDQLPELWRRPRVVLRDLRGRDWAEEPLSETWGRFFPHVRKDEVETHAYHRPLTLEFCQEYAEPLDDLLDAAFLLRSVFQTVALKNKRIKVGDAEGDRLEGARLALLALADPVSQTLVDAGGRFYRQYWSSPSLLASYASMMLQDLGDRRLRFVRCQRCEKVFSTYAYQADYCSGTCRRAAYKGRKRKKKQKEQRQRQRSASEHQGDQEEGVANGEARTE